MANSHPKEVLRDDLKRKLGRAGIRVLLLCLAFTQAPPASAQVPFNACLDRQGRVIPGVADNTIPYAGVATVRDGAPVILWNYKENRHLPRTEQIFIYLHECARHTLGTSTTPTTPRLSSWRPTAGPFSSWWTAA